MPRHARAVASTLTLSPSSVVNTIPNNHHQSHSYLHNTSYGLLEPAPLSIRPPSLRPSLQHRRKSSSSSSSPVWSDWEFDFKDLKERSADLGEKIGDKLPGVKYSAAFLSTLRVNLALSASLAPPSPNSLATTPGLPPNSNLLLTPITRMPTSDASSSDPLTNLPPLDFEPAQSSKDRTDALKLVSDSVTQQRSTASSTLVFHPLTLAIFVTLIAGAYPLLVKRSGDLPILFTTGVGIFMMILGIIRYIVKPYEDLAENINWNWLGDDEMVVALYGGTVIGTCVYRIEQGSKKKSGSGSPGSGGKRALIRAWTVRRRERGRGIGRGLLERLVDICAKEKGCDGIEFAPVGLRAGAERVLPDWTAGGGLMKFNSELDRREARAEECLKDVMREKRFGDKKRRGSR